MQSPIFKKPAKQQGINKNYYFEQVKLRHQARQLSFSGSSHLLWLASGRCLGRHPCLAGTQKSTSANKKRQAQPFGGGWDLTWWSLRPLSSTVPVLYFGLLALQYPGRSASLFPMPALRFLGWDLFFFLALSWKCGGG